MIEKTLLRMYSHAMQNLDSKLKEMDSKLDHIIFRLREMDPRMRPSREEDERELNLPRNEDT